MIFNVSKLNGTFGIEKLGKPPLTLAKSPTLGISILRARTNTVVKSIATKVDGTIFVILGKNQITNMVSNTNSIE